MSLREDVNEIPINQIISRVKHLEIRARKLVSNTLQSDYKSMFKGRGIEFNEVRGYFPGDDIRDIDWNVTARMGEPFVKTYIEERELTVIFAVDISGSSEFGTQKSKRQVMAEIVALLGFTSFFNNDRTGLFLFSGELEKTLPPVKNHSHLLRMIRDTWYYEPQYKGTNIAGALRSLRNLLKKPAIIFLLSDFIDTDYEKELMSLSRRHEVIPIVIGDPMESKLNFNLKSPLPVFVDVEDLELGSTQTVDLRAHKDTDLTRFRRISRGIFGKLGLDYTEISSEEDYFKKIELLLRKRARG